MDSHKYEASTPLWKNELGTLSGVRFIWSNLAPCDSRCRSDRRG